MRVLLSVWGVIATQGRAVPAPAPLDAERVFTAAFPWAGSRLAEGLLGNWMHWDTVWYLEIAIFGYSPETGNIIFPPLYPLLIRGLGLLLGGHYLLAALIVSNVACVGFLILLYRLIALDFSPELARRTILYLLAFPTGFFLLAGYSEAVFLCLFVLALYAARQDRWGWAGAAAFLASLARLQGWVLTFPLLYFWVKDRFLPAWRAQAFDRRSLGSVGSSLVMAGGGGFGTVAFMAYVYLVGWPSIEHVFAKQWHMQIGMPWDSLILAARALWSGDVLFQDVGNILVALFCILLTALGLRRLPVFYSLFTAPVLLFTLMRYFPAIQLNGWMRYALIFFPGFILVARWGQRSVWLHRVWLTVSLLFQVIFVAWFVNWIWVS